MILNLIDGFLFRIEKGVIAIGLIVLAFMVFINVSTRFLLNWSWIGTEEISTFITIWITFLGTAFAARKGLHITMSALFDRIPERPRKVLWIIITFITAIFCFILAVFGWQLTQFAVSTGHVSSALRIPYFLFYLPIPIGMLLTGIQFGRIVIRNLKQKGLYLGSEAEEQME